MKLINVLYDYEYDDVEDIFTDIGNADVLSVPDFVCNNLDEVVRKFFKWADSEVRNAERSKYPEYWTQLSNGETCMGINSEHFVKWLNDNYLKCENQKSVLIKIDANYNPDYPTAKF